MIVAPLQPETAVLDRVAVRLVQEAERPEFDRRLEAEHYLASSALVGETLRYVAELDGQWVALLTFSAPALHLKARERWIGWTPRQRARRLGLVVKNSPLLARAARPPYPQLALPGSSSKASGTSRSIAGRVVAPAGSRRSARRRGLAGRAGIFIRRTGSR